MRTRTDFPAMVLWLVLPVVMLWVWLALSAEPSAAAHSRGASPDLTWQHLSTSTGTLDAPSESPQQVLAIILDINKDGLNDFVIGARRAPGPSLVWYQRQANGWTRRVIDSSALQMEAGGAFHDIDGDGDLDIVAGSNNQNNEIWWWENPYPNYSGDWTRRDIKNGGSNKHHDMMFGNFDDAPDIEFVYWNQAANRLAIIDIPDNPRTAGIWPDERTVWNSPTVQYEGLAQADVDGDGKSDIIGGGRWFKFNGNGFTGDREGNARWFQWNGSNWVGQTLPIGTVFHAHSLDVGDVNSDGHLDIFLAEMRELVAGDSVNPAARSLILFGNGAGGFTTHTIATGLGNHESRLGDLDGDGDLDILGKPFVWDTPRLDIWLNGSEGDPPACEPLDNWMTHVIDDDRPWRAVFIDSADLDGDDRPDIVAGAWWYRNPGAPGGAWQRTAIGAPFNQLALIADFDNDGDNDILGTVASDEANRHKGKEFVWARNNGSGDFAILSNVPTGSGDFLQGAVVGAFAGEGRQVALSWHNMNGGIEALQVPANPGNTEWPLTTFSSAAAGEELSAGDIDGDGDADLLLGATWLENDAPGWTVHTLAEPNHHADRNRLADMDGDGDLDAVVGFEGISVSRPIVWYEQPASPTDLWPEHPIGNVIGPQSLDVGDLDGDGDMDVVVGEHNVSNSNNGKVYVFEQSGNGWERHTVATGHEHHDGTQLVDIDHDGDLDIISIGWGHDNVLLYEHVSCSVPPTPAATPTPSHTPTATQTQDPETTPTETSTPSPTTPAIDTPTPSATPPGPGSDTPAYLLSSTSGGTVGDVTFADEDLLRLDATTGQWSLYVDGSDIGLAKRDIDAVHQLGDGSILLSVEGKLNVAGLAVNDSDILRFTPTSLGANTAGTLSMYFDGSDVGLTTDGEDIDSLTLTGDGALLLGFLSTANANGLGARDEDLLLFQPATLGANTTGTWSFYFDGSDVGLDQDVEDVWGAALEASGRLLLTSPGTTSLGTLTVGAADVYQCPLSNIGTTTACEPAPSAILRGANHGFGAEIIDAMAVVNGSAPPLPTGTPPSPTATATPPACVPRGGIGEWQWRRHVIDPSRPGRATFVFTFDVNGDGRADVLTGKFWYANPGVPGGNWSRTQLPAPIEDVIAAFDFDGDGDRDLLASTGATEPMDQSYWWPFVWARNNGGGVFTVFNNLNVSGINMPKNDPVQGVAIARYSPGGPLEVAVTWDDTERPKRNPYGVQMFTVPANPAEGTWARRKLSDTSTGEQLSAADLDNDNDLDLFMGSVWLRNNHPAATWTPITTFTVDAGQASRHELADVDGDGDSDAFIGYSHNPQGRHVSWHERGNSPTAIWPERRIETLNRGYAESLDAADVDGDGDPDVIVGEYNMRQGIEYPSSLWIFENRGQGDNWAQHLVYHGDSHYQSSQAFDIDGDGDLDILSKGWHHSRVHLYENLGCSP